MDDMLAVIEQYASILTDTSGNDHDDIADEWAAESFTPAEVAQWAEAHCFHAASAAQLRDMGVGSTAAATFAPATVGAGSYVDTLGFKFANGDLSLGDVRALLAG